MRRCARGASLVSVMRLYADLPQRRTRQIAADLLMLGWVLAWVLAGRAVQEATLSLAAPGLALEDAGGEFRDRMIGAGTLVDDLPLIRDRLAAPFQQASGVGTDIAAAGTSLVVAAERVALVAGLATALAPIIIVGAFWLFLRLRWARRATVAARFLDSGADLDLFALRAMAHQSIAALALIDDDPAGAWRRGDPAVVSALAGLELADLGLRAPGGTTPQA